MLDVVVIAFVAVRLLLPALLLLSLGTLMQRKHLTGNA
jgi:hypothetical protein